MLAEGPHPPRGPSGALMAGLGQPVIVKRYGNDRLYDAGSARYVTTPELAAMVKAGAAIVVIDAKTGEDMTQQILTRDNSRG